MMLKIFFWLLLLTNAVLFAFHQGYLGHARTEPREASRLAQQLQPEKIRLISESSAKAAMTPLFAHAAPAATAATPATSATSATPATSAASAACVEIGNFGGAEAQRFSAQLAALGLQPKTQVRSLTEAADSAAGYMVYLAAPADRAALEQRTAELRQSGINDFFVLPQSATLPGAISLGIFKSEDSARLQQAKLLKKGLRDVRLHARGASVSKQAFQLQGLDEQQQAALDQLRAGFPQQQARACAAAASAKPAG
jgi:hypothetical protein